MIVNTIAIDIAIVVAITVAVEAIHCHVNADRRSEAKS
jgi:hypothetical protein